MKKLLSILCVTLLSSYCVAGGLTLDTTLTCKDGTTKHEQLEVNDTKTFAVLRFPTISLIIVMLTDKKNKAECKLLRHEDKGQVTVVAQTSCDIVAGQPINFNLGTFDVKVTPQENN